MTTQYVRLGSTQLYHDGKVHEATIDHQVDEEAEYTGCYRITLDNGTIIEVEGDYDGLWSEKDKGATEISQIIGKVIEQYHE